MGKVGWLAAAALILAAPSGALADDAKKTVKYERKTVINFEDDTIQGDLTRPDGEYLDARKKVEHSNLIRIRKNFRSEVLESVGEL
jgi:hypothetical protein